MATIKELVGTKLGRYTIVEHLATGGMAEIFLAHQDALGGFKKELVLKVLQSRWEEYPEVVDMFLAEARISALMNHPNIVDVFDVAIEKDKHFIAMEHIAGRTLTELAKRAIQVTKSIPPEIGVFIAAEMASALAYMYDGYACAGDPFQVVHRDISPTNVLVSATGQVKLIDFGIARQGRTVVQESGARPGKVTYMSPEQVRGQPIDGRSDIFCLGTILYEITLGKRLWRGPREVAVKRIVEERPKPPTFVRRDYPAELELIVLRTLEKDPDDRYQTATELHNDLQQFLARSNAHLRNNFQMADYVAKIFSSEADALISDTDRARAQAFVEGGEAAEVNRDDLDFDRQAEGPGAALARALRTSTLGVWAGLDRAEQSSTPASSSDSSPEAVSEPEAEPAPAVPIARIAKKEGTSKAPTATAKNATPTAKNATPPAPEKVPEARSPNVNNSALKGVEDEITVKVPRRYGGVIVVAVLVLAVVGMGFLWWLRGQ